MTAINLAEFHRRAAAGTRPKSAVNAEFRFATPLPGDDPQVVSFVFSDNSVDSYGDTIDVKGWVFDQSGAGTVALFGHDPSDVGNVIGRAHNVRAQGNQLVGDIHFATKDVNPKADVVRLLVLGGFINSVSVGFQPLEWQQTKDKSRPGGIDFKKQKLLEISVVPIPANENAVTLARAAGIDVDAVVDRAAPALNKKGLYAVSGLAGVLMELDWILDVTAWDAESGSAVPGILADALKALGAALVTMTEEAVAELIGTDDTVDGFVELAAPTPAQRALVALARATTVAKRQFVITSSAALSDPQVRRLRDQWSAFRAGHTDDLLVLDSGFAIQSLDGTIEKAGRTISAANEKTIRDAHGAIMGACDAIISVVGDPADDAQEKAAPAADAQADARKRKAAAAKLRHELAD